MDGRDFTHEEWPMATLGVILKQARIAKGLDRPYVSNSLGVSVSAVGQWERGDNEPSTENLQRLCNLYGIDAGAAMRGLFALSRIIYDGPMPDPDELSSEDVAADRSRLDPDPQATVGSETGRRGIPKDTLAQIDVTGGMGGGGLTIISDGVPGKRGMTFAAENVRDYWRLPTELLAGMGLHPHDIIVIPVQGDSMAGTLNEGDYVLVDTRHRLPSPDGLYALTDEFGGIVVKRLEVLRRTEEDVLIHVISDNERHPSKDRLLSEFQIIGRVVRRFGVIG